MKMDLTAKVTTFCRELGDDTLRDLARRKNKEELLRRAADALRAGEIGPGLEADLDALDAVPAASAPGVRPGGPARRGAAGKRARHPLQSSR